jgi:hypothetical protein
MSQPRNLAADPMAAALRSATRWERTGYLMGMLCIAVAAAAMLLYGLSGGAWSAPGH